MAHSQFRSRCGDLLFYHNRLAEPGDKCGGHTHKFDHVTIVKTGRVRVVVNGPGAPAAQTFELGVGDYVNVRAEDGHEVTALLPDSEFICIWHPERDPSVHRLEMAP